MKNNWTLKKVLKNIDTTVRDLNTSKIFTGLMIITLNIGSRFVNLKFSKSMEAYLKYTFSKQILIFSIIWMGTRDIYIALIGVIIFTILMDYLFNEESEYCCLPETFVDQHKEMMDNKDSVSDEDVLKAKLTIEKFEKQQQQEEVSNNENVISHGISNY
jgi:hypothetical protein